LTDAARAIPKAGQTGTGTGLTDAYGRGFLTELTKRFPVPPAEFYEKACKKKY
jgi:hypothetical protein